MSLYKWKYAGVEGRRIKCIKYLEPKENEKRPVYSVTEISVPENVRCAHEMAWH